MREVSEAGWVTRFLPVRAAKVDLQDGRTLKGYAIVFNSLSQDLGGWFERIAPQAVDRTLRSGANVDALIDHRQESMYVIGSTDSGLLKQSKDRHGLGVEIRPPNTTNARDLMTQVSAGLVKGMSFRFRVYDPTGDGAGRVWEEDEQGRLVRTVTDMVYDEVSVVVNPAYLDTEVSARTAESDRETLKEFKRSWRPSMATRERMIRIGM